MNCEFVVYIPCDYDGNIYMGDISDVLSKIADKIKGVFVYSMTFEKAGDRNYLLRIKYHDDKAEINVGGLKNETN